MYCTTGDINVATRKRGGMAISMRCQMPKWRIALPARLSKLSISIFRSRPSKISTGRFSFLPAVGARDATACLVLKCRSFYGARTLPESPINSRMRPRDRKAAGLATPRHAVSHRVASRRTCVSQSRETREQSVPRYLPTVKGFRRLGGNSTGVAPHDRRDLEHVSYNWGRVDGDARVAVRAVPGKLFLQGPRTLKRNQMCFNRVASSPSSMHEYPHTDLQRISPMKLYALPISICFWDSRDWRRISASSFNFTRRVLVIMFAALSERTRCRAVPCRSAQEAAIESQYAIRANEKR